MTNTIPRLLLAALLAAPTPVLAQFNEQEPNDSKGLASIATLDAQNPTISGAVVPGDADYWLIQIPRAARGNVYRHELSRVTSADLSISLRGLGQQAGAILLGSDVTVQGPGPEVVWYGGGLGSSVFVRVTSENGASGNYTFRLQTTQVAVGRLPNLRAGPITIHALNTSADTDLWIYGDSLWPIRGYGNDDAPTGGFRASLTRVFPFDPGAYYVAIGRRNLANNQPSPFDDGSRDGDVLDLAGGVACSERPGLGPVNLVFRHGNPERDVVYTAMAPETFGVHWVRFLVDPAASSPYSGSSSSNLSNTPGDDSFRPDVACDWRNVYAVWEEAFFGRTRTMLAYSADGGTTFAAARPVGAVPNGSGNREPAVAAGGGTVLVGYVTTVVPGLEQLVLYRGMQPSLSFQWAFATTGTLVGRPDLRVDPSGRTALVTYECTSATNPATTDVYVNVSTDGGMTFSPDHNLSQSSDGSRRPRVDTCGSKSYCVWVEEGNPSTVRYSETSDGVTWSTPVVVATLIDPPDGMRPDVACDPLTGVVAVVWIDDVAAAGDRSFAARGKDGAFGAPFQLDDEFVVVQSARVHGDGAGGFDVTLTVNLGGIFPGSPIRHLTFPATGGVPPSYADAVPVAAGVPATGAATASGAAGDIVTVFEQGNAPREIAAVRGSFRPRYRSVGLGGCAGETGVASVTVQGDLRGTFRITSGPTAPRAPGALFLAGGLSAAPFHFGRCAFELDAATLFAVPIIADATGAHAFTVQNLSPGTVVVQTCFVDSNLELVFGAAARFDG